VWGDNMEWSMCFLNMASVESQLTSCNRDCYEKLVVPQLVKKMRCFTKLWSPLLCSQQPKTYPHFQTVELSTCLPTCFSKFHFNTILSPVPRRLKFSPYFVFPHHNPVCIPVLPTQAACPTHPILFLIWSPL
jgi:hypothetical protein